MFQLLAQKINENTLQTARLSTLIETSTQFKTQNVKARIDLKNKLSHEILFYYIGTIQKNVPKQTNA